MNSSPEADGLAGHSLPGFSSDYRKLLRPKRADVNPELIKDGYIYVFRGDYPNLEDKGIYSASFHRLNVNVDQMLEVLKGEELHSHWDFGVRNKLEEFMWKHSNGGYENFLSTTPSFDAAIEHSYKNDPGHVYVLKVPVERAFTNYASVCLDKEKEILIPEYVLPESIIAVIDPKNPVLTDVRSFMR